MFSVIDQRLIVTLFVALLQYAQAFDPAVVKQKGSVGQIILIVAMCIIGVIIVAIIVRIACCKPKVNRQIKESKYDTDHFNKQTDEQERGFNNFPVKNPLGEDMQPDFTEPAKRKDPKSKNRSTPSHKQDKYQSRDLEKGVVMGQPVKGSKGNVQMQPRGVGEGGGSSRKKVPAKYDRNNDEEGAGIDLNYRTERKDQVRKNQGRQDSGRKDQGRQDSGRRDQVRQDSGRKEQGRSNQVYNNQAYSNQPRSNNQRQSKSSSRNIYNSDSSDDDEPQGQYRAQIKQQLKRDASKIPSNARYQG